MEKAFVYDNPCPILKLIKLVFRFSSINLIKKTRVPGLLYLLAWFFLTSP